MRRARPRGRVQLELTRRVRAWSPPRAELARWAGMALGARAAGGELAVSVVGPAESRRLNARYRGRDRATNVLSFPAPAQPRRPTVRSLGDLVVCPGVLRREARAQAKTLRAHWAHLIVHGTLHLIGYEHERARDAQRMERREIAVLKRLGFANPYRSVVDDG
ncbi:MAG TPA: rRNA maturation RNase YbeY [Steroidobacteraceae bacterium]|nr:rRNA maturation RNase YbeY [Steroidobacteraceae bacterium]